MINDNEQVLRQVVNEDDCRAYVRDVLSSGGALSAALGLELHRFRRYYTTVHNAASARDFWSGGWSASEAVQMTHGKVERIADDTNVVVELIRTHCARDESNICLLENVNARRGDPYLRKLTSSIAYSGETVLHFLKNGATEGQIKDALREARNIPIFAGAAATSAAHLYEHFRDEATLGDETVTSIAHNSQLIFVGAYDGEGYIVAVPAA